MEEGILQRMSQVRTLFSSLSSSFRTTRIPSSKESSWPLPEFLRTHLSISCRFQLFGCSTLCHWHSNSTSYRRTGSSRKNFPCLSLLCRHTTKAPAISGASLLSSNQPHVQTLQPEFPVYPPAFSSLICSAWERALPCVPTGSPVHAWKHTSNVSHVLVMTWGFPSLASPWDGQQSQPHSWPLNSSHNF